jgi:hypothetical protein
MAMSKFSKDSVSLPHAVHKDPIPCISKVKKIDNVDATDTDNTEWIKLKCFMDPDNPALAPN